MKSSALVPVLSAALRTNENILLTGGPGIGKTSVVEQAAKALGYRCLTMHPVVSDPTDFKGMPATFTRDGVMVAEFLPFGDLQQMIDATEPLVVLMDDVGQAPMAVQAALMQLLLARKLNGHHLSEHVRFVACTNRRSDKAGVTGMITPLLDRFTLVLELEFHLDDWIVWGTHNNMPPELLAFGRFRPDLFNTFEATLDMKKSATPRSIAGLGRFITKTGIDDFETMAGATGDKFATEFLAFRRTYLNLPNVETIWANPKTVAVPTELDVLYALMGALAHRADVTNFDATVEYLRRCPPEFGVVCVKDSLLRRQDLGKSKAFMTWATENRELFGFLR